MSWFGRDSPLRSSFTRRKYSFSPPPKPNEDACLEVFKMHWQQARYVMEKNGPGQQFSLPNADDITSIINYLDQMMTLLLQEAHHDQRNRKSVESSSGPILSYFLMEHCLDKLFTWSIHTGEFVNIMKQEQLKLYEILVASCHQDLLFHKPVVRPLLRLLASCGECSPVEVEKRLVILLNTLCVCLTQFPDLLQVFFGASSDHGATRSENPRDIFLIFSLLIPFVHREGSIGQQARDALLLCMALSRRDESIGIYIAEHSNFCPVLATGLSGLYSVLPRKLPTLSEDWHHFTPEDISDIPELAMFLNSLEFCNAVIQVAHPLVQEQLLEYLYQGFLIPVLGPALHQNTVEEIIATTAYLELFLRTLTEPILLQVFLKFILTSHYDGHSVLNTLTDRLGAQGRLCLVTMALFRRLLDLNCEDVLFQLVLRYLIPCSHIMVSQRSRIRDLDIYSCSADKFLSLVPNCCNPDGSSSPDSSRKAPPVSARAHPVVPGELHYVKSGEKFLRGGSLRIKRHQRSTSTSSFSFGDLDKNHFGNSNVQTFHPAGLEMLNSSYADYLKEAHTCVKSCTLACRGWSATYDGRDPPPESYISAKQNKEPGQSGTGNSVILNGYCNLHANDSINTNDFQKRDVSLSQMPQNAHETCLREKISKLESSVDAVIPEATMDCHTQSLFTSLNDREALSNTTEKHIKTESGEFLCQLVDAEDEKIFWSLLSSTKTPSSVSDLDDSLETIDLFLKEVELTNSIKSNTATFDTKDEGSNTDSGVFECRESTSLSDRDADVVPVILSCAKSKVEDINQFALTLPCSSKSDNKLMSSSTSEVSSNSPVSPGNWESFGSPDVGPFLSILLTRLEMMTQNDVYTNLHLTGLLSRLAWYPQPLLRSFLLNHSLVFQPTVRSLLQVLGSLKHKVDSYSYTVDNFEDLIVKSQQFLLAREEQLLQNANCRSRNPSESTLYRVRCGSTPEIHRGETRRRSLTSILFRRGSLLKGKDRTLGKGPALESISDGQGYRYISKPTPDALEGEMESVKTKNAVLCAVILEEFLKELAAITQEHATIQLDPDFWDAKWQLRA